MRSHNILTERASSGGTLSFSFTGGAREYFKIWIVNVLLNVLTLGIYSPWAKARTKSYFRGHTWVDGSTFEYIGRPRVILARRLLGLGLLVLGILGALRLPHAGAFSTVVCVLGVPWLVMMERIFDVRNSAYRNVRFDWKSSRREMMVVFFLPLLLVITFGLALPYCVYRRQRLLVAHSLYGTIPLELTASLKDFGKIYLKSATMAMAGAVLSTALVAVLATPVNRTDPNLLPSIRVPALLVLPWLSLGLLYSGTWAYPRAALSHLIATNTCVGDCRLGFRPRVSEMLALDLSSAAGVVFSLGLLIPWARIRRASHELDGLTLRTGGFCNGFPVAGLPVASSKRVEPRERTQGNDRRGAALRDVSSIFALAAIVVAIAVPVLRYSFIAPPRWLDDLIGTGMVWEFLLLSVTTVLVPIEVPLVALLGLGLLLRRRWFLRREDGRWAMRPWCAVVLWGLLAVNAPVLNVTPGLTQVYAGAAALLALSISRPAKRRVGPGLREEMRHSSFSSSRSSCSR